MSVETKIPSQLAKNFVLLFKNKMSLTFAKIKDSLQSLQLHILLFVKTFQCNRERVFEIASLKEN